MIADVADLYPNSRYFVATVRDSITKLPGLQSSMAVTVEIVGMINVVVELRLQSEIIASSSHQASPRVILIRYD